MDPITKCLVEYNEYLNNGGEPVNLKKLGFDVCSERQKVRKLHPSSLGPGLCDRKACYHVMADVGEIQKDFEITPQEELGHRVGYIFEDWVSEALAWKGALLNLQPQLENKLWIGRPDQVVDPSALGEDIEGLWLVDCKTVKGYGFYDRYPKPYHISQVEKYVEMIGGGNFHPVLFYMTRVDFQSALWTWGWAGDDCRTAEWGTRSKPFFELRGDIRYSIAMQERWLRTGELPDRCCSLPIDHFMCASYQKYGQHKGRYLVNCQYFSRCWEVPLPTNLVFDKADWEDESALPF